MPLAIINPSEVKPITLPQIKQHLRVDHNEEDQYLLDLLDGAVAHVEATIGQALIFKTVRQYVDQIPASRSVVLEVSCVKSIEAIRGFDTSGNANIFSPEEYHLDNRMNIPAVIFNTSISYDNFYNGIEIDLVTGFGATGVDVPSNITRAILVLIAHWYEFRGAIPLGDQLSLIPEGIDTLLAPVRRVKL